MHTPGPWGLVNQTRFGQLRDDGGFNPIGFVYAPAFAERSDSGRTALANARLIAAAPDLATAIKPLSSSSPEIHAEFVAMLERDPNATVPLHMPVRCILAADAALAKVSQQQGTPQADGAKNSEAKSK